MSYLVVRDFVDKYTKKLHKKGSVYTSHDDVRLAELQQASLGGFSGPFIEQIEDKPGAGATVKELKQYLDTNGIEYDVSAKKTDLLRLI